MSPDHTFTFGWIALFGLLGFAFVQNLSFLKNNRIPGSVVGGILGLISVQLLRASGFKSMMLEDNLEFIRSLPALLINVVFATLMLGIQPIKVKRAFKLASPNILMGHAFAWGQHWIGSVLALTVLPIWYGSDAQLLTPLIAVGFQGGHGTASGLKKTFDALGFPQGVDLGLGVATGGIFVGLISGLFLFSWLEKREKDIAVDPQEGRPTARKDCDEHRKTVQIMSTWTLQGGFVALTIGAAWIILQCLTMLEQVFVDTPSQGLTQYIPLFPMVLLTSLLLNGLFRKANVFRFLNKPIIEDIGATALELLIIAALISLNLDILFDYTFGLLLLIFSGVAWNTCLVLLAAKHIYPSPWYAHALTDYGGATATTATGLVLADLSPSGKRSRIKEAYSLKQPFYEPLMGGGLITALALPMIGYLGLWGYFVLVSAVLVTLAIMGYFLHRRRQTSP